MSDRQFVLDLVQKLPGDMPLADILREISFIAGVNEALAQSERGEGIPIEEARKMVKIWAKQRR